MTEAIDYRLYAIARSTIGQAAISEIVERHSARTTSYVEGHILGAVQHEILQLKAEIARLEGGGVVLNRVIAEQKEKITKLIRGN